VLATNYGQTPNSSQIALPGTSTKITSTAWGNLRGDILRANRHQLNPAAVGTLTDPTTSTKIAAADYNAYETMANACLTNSLLFPDTSTLSSITSLSSGDLTGYTWGQTGRNTLKIVVYVNFTSLLYRQYFFNSGGQIRWSNYFTGGTVATPGTKDYSWKSAANEMGTVIFDANSTRTLAGATGAGTGSAIGNYQLTSSDQLVYSKLTSTYAPNTVRIFAKQVGGTSIGFTIEYEDLNDPAGTYTIDEDVTATLSTSLSAYYGSGTGEVDATLFRPTLGAFTVTAIASPNP
jgi:hypothetical protein